MLSIKALLLYSALATGAWSVTDGINQWHLVLQVACAITVSLSIFFAILRATESAERRVTESRSDGTLYRPRRVRVFGQGHPAR
jgi:hypothetical protein